MANTARSDIWKAAVLIRTGTPIEAEKARVNLIRKKLVSYTCLDCTHFLGNYRGRYRYENGKYIPLKSHRQCYGKQGALVPCLFYTKQEEGSD